MPLKVIKSTKTNALTERESGSNLVNLKSPQKTTRENPTKVLKVQKSNSQAKKLVVAKNLNIRLAKPKAKVSDPNNVQEYY